MFNDYKYSKLFQEVFEAFKMPKLGIFFGKNSQELTLNEIVENMREMIPDLSKNVIEDRVTDVIDNCKDRKFYFADLTNESYTLTEKDNKYKLEYHNPNILVHLFG